MTVHPSPARANQVTSPKQSIRIIVLEFCVISPELLGAVAVAPSAIRTCTYEVDIGIAAIMSDLFRFLSDWTMSMIRLS